jgi:hypothetical protein
MSLFEDERRPVNPERRDPEHGEVNVDVGSISLVDSRDLPQLRIGLTKVTKHPYTASTHILYTVT